MTQYLPPNLLALFQAREPIPYLPPVVRLNHEKKTKGYNGVGPFLHFFEDPKDTPFPVKIETREERFERKKREKAERITYLREQGIALWDPYNNQHATSDPFKTLFVARVNTEISESKLRREFEGFGPIRKIMMIHDKISGKSKGYAFIEYENEKDMHSAYKYGDGKKIEGRRVLVDVERGRTVKGWLPRRLGGGLGDKPGNFYNEDRDEKSYRDRDRLSVRRDRDRSRRSKSKDRERVRDRDEKRREHRSDRDRHKDRYEKNHDNYSEHKFGKDGGDSYNSSSKHRHRSRDERKDRKRSNAYTRSRSRSPQQKEHNGDRK